MISYNATIKAESCSFSACQALIEIGQFPAMNWMVLIGVNCLSIDRARGLAKITTESLPVSLIVTTNNFVSYMSFQALSVITIAMQPTLFLQIFSSYLVSKTAMFLFIARYTV